MTPEQDKQLELETRVKAFNADLIPLLGKYKLGLGAIAFIANDGRVLARPQVFDDSASHEKKPDESAGTSEAPAAEKPAEPAAESPVAAA
jgi:hypothetical protein